MNFKVFAFLMAFVLAICTAATIDPPPEAGRDPEPGEAPESEEYPDSGEVPEDPGKSCDYYHTWKLIFHITDNFNVNFQCDKLFFFLIQDMLDVCTLVTITIVTSIAFGMVNLLDIATTITNAFAVMIRCQLQSADKDVSSKEIGAEKSNQIVYHTT